MEETEKNPPYGKVEIRGVADYTQALVNQGVEELFQGLEVTKTLNSSQKVVLKPNLLAKRAPEYAVTTHPAVVRAVILACKKRGVPGDHITIADSAGGLYNPKQMNALYQGCGLTQIAEEEGVHLYTGCESMAVSCSGGVVSQFHLITPIYQADVLINLPKFKSHVMTGMTAGCKNLFGAIPGLQKSEWHTRFPQRDPFGQMLIDLLEVIPPTFTLLDGILAMEGDGPGGGDPRSVGVLIASEDTLHLDLAVAHMMGLSPKVVPYLEAGRTRGLCGAEVDLRKVQGDVALCAPIPHWKLPKSYEKDGVGAIAFSQMLPKILRPLGEALEEMVAPRPVVVEKDCIGCGKCKEICSKDAIDIRDNKAKIKQKPCIRCFCCHEVCPVKAISIASKGFFHR